MIVLRTDATFGGLKANAPFEFRMDPATGNYVAGAAYLRDDGATSGGDSDGGGDPPSPPF